MAMATRPGLEENVMKQIQRQGARLASSLIFCAGMVCPAPFAIAQGAFPTKPIRLIVSVAPGGGADALGRLSAAKVSERLGVPVVVENIAGASGLIGIQTIVKATPDAYTLGINSSSSYNSTMYSGRIPGDPKKLLEPVAQLTSQPLVLVVSPTLSIQTMQDLIAFGRKNPDALNFASAGIGTSSHLLGELVNQKAGLKMEHVAYKGIGPGLLDVISGRIQIAFGTPGAVGPHTRTGKLRAIATSSAKRSPGLPDLPTMAEQGLDIDWTSWFGIFTTFGSPRSNVLTLNAAFNQAAALPEMQKMFAVDGSDPAPGTPEQFGTNVSHVLETGARLIKEMGLKLE
jgi:tripartite-type tricarboxylate transporter receptor subunit TctC